MFTPEELALDLAPATFFPMEIACQQLKEGGLKKLGKKYLLPDLTGLCDEISWSEFFLGWHPDGIAATVVVDLKATGTHFPNYRDGDSVELFIDTRNRKESGYATRFCHHFVFLPIPVEGVDACEVSRFRVGEDHTLCDPHLLQCETKLGKEGYLMNLFIPSECLYGYDPAAFEKLGFTYRINGGGEYAQHFTVVGEEFPIEQRPALWSTLRLI